ARRIEWRQRSVVVAILSRFELALALPDPIENLRRTHRVAPGAQEFHEPADQDRGDDDERDDEMTHAGEPTRARIRVPSDSIVQTKRGRREFLWNAVRLGAGFLVLRNSHARTGESSPMTVTELARALAARTITTRAGIEKVLAAIDAPDGEG